jgi:hypothetical protein
LAVLKFTDWWGPLTFNYEHYYEDLEESKLPLPMITTPTRQHYDNLGIPPINYMLAMANEMQSPREDPENWFREAKVIKVKVKGKWKLHVQPPFLSFAIEWAAFSPETLMAKTCKYRLETGGPRGGYKWQCPPGCIIDSQGGKKFWGEGCQEALRRLGSKSNK